jgi:Domain of unknown function (DUF4148)
MLKMKSLLIAMALIGATTTTAAFAQTSAAPATANSTSTATAQAGQWQPPYGQPVQEKTRAQVYAELVHAEQDGQLAYLNSTVYEGN